MSYDVQWNGPFENFSRGYAARNFWRVASVLGSREDALQECALVFADCRMRYSAKEGMNGAWMMSLFKTSLTNHYNNLSVKDVRFRTIDEHPDEEGGPIEVPVPADAEFCALIAGLPEEVASVLSIMLNAPAEMIEMLGYDLGAEKFNQRVRRFFKKATGRGIYQDIQEALAP